MNTYGAELPLTELLQITIVAGLSAGGLASFLRALPWPEKIKKKKPIGCPLCMAGWSAFLTVGSALYNFFPIPLAPAFHGVSGLVTIFEILLLTWFGAMGIGAWIAAQVQPSWEV